MRASDRPTAVAAGFLFGTPLVLLVPFVPLAVGPAAGTVAMLRPRASPESELLAGGRG